MNELDGKVAVVTGGAQGVGFGLARALAEEGMQIVLADIAPEQLDEAVATLVGDGTDAVGFVADVADADAVEHLRDLAFERFGTVHVLCNNAGTSRPGSLHPPIDISAWERIAAINVYSILHGLNAFLPRMLEQGEGHIVNTSSRQGLVPTPNLGPYPPTKSASIAVTEMLRMELEAMGAPIGTTVLTPGGVRTENLVEQLARHERGELHNETMHAFLASRVADAVEPLELGRLVVRAIRANVLYVNTHAETLDWLQERVDRIKADAATLGTLR